MSPWTMSFVPDLQSYAEAYFAPGLPSFSAVCCVPGLLCSLMKSGVTGLLYFLRAVALEAYSWVVPCLQYVTVACWAFVRVGVLPAWFVWAGVVQPVLLMALL